MAFVTFELLSETHELEGTLVTGSAKIYSPFPEDRKWLYKDPGRLHGSWNDLHWYRRAGLVIGYLIGDTLLRTSS